MVECAGLENQSPRKRTAGSNPAPSAPRLAGLPTHEGRNDLFMAVIAVRGKHRRRAAGRAPERPGGQARAFGSIR